MIKASSIIIAFLFSCLMAKPAYSQPVVDPMSKEFLNGKEKATIAISKRKLTFIVSGELEITDGTYEGEDFIFKKMMWKRYRVAIVNFGDTTGPKEINFSAGYNDEIASYLTKRYGVDVVSKTASEAKAIYEKRRERALLKAKRKRFGTYRN